MSSTGVKSPFATHIPSYRMPMILLPVVSTIKMLLVVLLAIVYHSSYQLVAVVESFIPSTDRSNRRNNNSIRQFSFGGHQQQLQATAYTSNSVDDDNIDSANDYFENIEERKRRLLSVCESKDSILLNEVRDVMADLEEYYIRTIDSDDSTAQQEHDIYNWMSGEWELVYSPVDVTRSSPFFWAFRTAFPDQADQVYGITDAIPSPLKEVGPAYQQIECMIVHDTAGRMGSSSSNKNSNSAASGTFVSRVKIATLGCLATSMMTTRATIIGLGESYGDLRIKVETTKAEQSTVLETLFGAQYGTMINDAIPAYPSGETLEQIMAGSSEVTVQTTFCDPTIRITKNKFRPIDEFFIWKRKSFNTYETV